MAERTPQKKKPISKRIQQAQSTFLLETGQSALESLNAREAEFIISCIRENTKMCHVLAELIKNGTVNKMLHGETFAEAVKERLLPSTWTRQKWKSFGGKYAQTALRHLLGDTRYTNFTTAMGNLAADDIEGLATLEADLVRFALNVRAIDAFPTEGPAWRKEVVFLETIGIRYREQGQRLAAWNELEPMAWGVFSISVSTTTFTCIWFPGHIFPLKVEKDLLEEGFHIEGNYHVEDAILVLTESKMRIPLAKMMTKHEPSLRWPITPEHWTYPASPSTPSQSVCTDASVPSPGEVGSNAGLSGDGAVESPPAAVVTSSPVSPPRGSKRRSDGSPVVGDVTAPPQESQEDGSVIDMAVLPEDVSSGEVFTAPQGDGSVTGVVMPPPA